MVMTKLCVPDGGFDQCSSGDTLPPVHPRPLKTCSFWMVPPLETSLLASVNPLSLPQLASASAATALASALAAMPAALRRLPFAMDCLRRWSRRRAPGWAAAPATEARCSRRRRGGQPEAWARFGLPAAAAVASARRLHLDEERRGASRRRGPGL